VAYVQLWQPHVDGDALDHAAVFEAVQPAGQGAAVAVGQHLDVPPPAIVGDDQALPHVNLGLIQAEPLGHLRRAGAIDVLDVLAGQGTGCLLVAAHVVGHDADEGVHQALLLDVLGAALGHTAVLADVGQRLAEGLDAVPELVQAHFDHDAHLVSTIRAVSVRCGVGAMSVPVADDAPALPGLRLDQDRRCPSRLGLELAGHARPSQPCQALMVPCTSSGDWFCVSPAASRAERTSSGVGLDNALSCLGSGGLLLQLTTKTTPNFSSWVFR